ncbi:hypothetical protein [Corynebacterium auris]|nr:hypothetical protein [Corynebacterium auris]WJY68102.1 hypothetical protein CAURIS_06000 [Corynebacterium auris]
MDTKATDPDVILGDRRDELDALDAQLLDILRRRCCDRLFGSSVVTFR